MNLWRPNGLTRLVTPRIENHGNLTTAGDPFGGDQETHTMKSLIPDMARESSNLKGGKANIKKTLVKHYTTDALPYEVQEHSLKMSKRGTKEVDQYMQATFSQT